MPWKDRSPFLVSGRDEVVLMIADVGIIFLAR